MPGYMSNHRTYYPFTGSSSRPSRYGRRSMYHYNFDTSPTYTSSYSRPGYRYGRRRRRPYYWERDRSTYNRLWRRNRRRSRRATSRDRDSSPESEPEPPRPVTPPPPPKPVEVAKDLVVEDVELFIKENAEKNMTDDYECTDSDRANGEPAEMVVRRGNMIKMKITFDRPYEKEKHDLSVCFSIGESPKESNSTMVLIKKIDEDGRKDYGPFEWGAYLDSRSGNDIVIMVHMAANAIVGEWNLSLITYVEGKDKDGKETKLTKSYDHSEDITILFNPWCKDDSTYMEKTDLLDEYVLNDSGCVYRGNSYSTGAKPWNFGQFEDGILEICLYLVRSGFRNGISKKMADPVQTSRIIGKMVNSSDDSGVLVGNWSGDYGEHTPPTKWGGTPRILQQFMQSGPVRYGQCWVFSCITTTVCRCLGIPCRTVTNFESAHDADASNLIEKIYDLNGEEINKTGDSVWNFHVWNEVYMTRPDLSDTAYDGPGWQVVDATPQEQSDGVYQCGPCPVEAVKNGDVDLNYDAGFIFSEVNADRAEFVKLNDGTFKLSKLLKDSVGKKISTKVPDGKPFKDSTYGAGGMRFDRYGYDEKKREDITLQYKYPEHSEEERIAVKKAFEIAKKKRLHNRPDKVILDPYDGKPDGVAKPVVPEKLKFEIKYDDNIMIGSDFSFELHATNPGKRTQQLWYMQVSVYAKSYTGEIAENAFYEDFIDGSVIESGKSWSYTVTLQAVNYFRHLMEQANLHIKSRALVVFEGEYTPHQDELTTTDLRFRRPDLDIEGPESGKTGYPVEFEVSFKNPAPVALTNCEMSIGSAGFKDIEDQKVNDVPAGGFYKGRFKLVPRNKKKKEHEVSFTFDCKELKDISGSTSIMLDV